MKLSSVVADPAHLKPSVVFAPTAQEFLEGIRTTSVRVGHEIQRTYFLT